VTYNCSLFNNIPEGPAFDFLRAELRSGLKMRLPADKLVLVASGVLTAAEAAEMVKGDASTREAKA
jgi:hypothetical protein